MSVLCEAKCENRDCPMPPHDSEQEIIMKSSKALNSSALADGPLASEAEIQRLRLSNRIIQDCLFCLASHRLSTWHEDPTAHNWLSLRELQHYPCGNLCLSSFSVTHNGSKYSCFLHLLCSFYDCALASLRREAVGGTSCEISSAAIQDRLRFERRTII